MNITKYYFQMMYLSLTLTAWLYLVFAAIKKKFYLESGSLAKSSSPDNKRQVTSSCFSVLPFSLLTSSFIGSSLLDSFIVCANDSWESLCRVPEGRILVFVVVV